MGEKLQNNLEILLQQLEGFLTTKTVVGEPIHIDNTILVPLVDVSFGVGAGAAATSNMPSKNADKPIKGMSDTGGGGLGAKITPTAMLVIQDGTTQLINIKKQDSISKLIDMVPGLISKVSEEFRNKGPKTPKSEKAEAETEAYIKDKMNNSYHEMNDK
ncbi:MAG TPA: sporulation protein [Epulopiscium sp.]|nr:sporulation protein [Candidatus Epulonipiscium sp.]